jgi:uncharacterized ferritin-like protein (DUF455 family)
MTNEDSTATTGEVRAAALAALQTTAPAEKCACVAHLGEGHRAGAVRIDPARDFGAPPGVPGRPVRPALVDPASVPRRHVRSAAGRIALLHALAHIEFNAINLALDAIWRYPGLPESYYGDWLRVAVEEAEHFRMLEERLAAHGARYGDCDAHDGLWEMAHKTAADALERMALVPRILEARGLDASPGVILKLRGCGDEASAQVVERILHDEVGHVAIGNRWFGWLCAQRGVDPVDEFRRVARRYDAPRLKPPLNLEARRRAGFSSVELSAMSQSSEWP